MLIKYKIATLTGSSIEIRTNDVAQPLFGPIGQILCLDVAVVLSEIYVEAGIGLRSRDLRDGFGFGQLRYFGQTVVLSVVAYHLRFPQG